MMTVFYDVDGILLIDFLHHKQTITGQYYEQLLGQLGDALKRKHRGKLTNGM